MNHVFAAAVAAVLAAGPAQDVGRSGDSAGWLHRPWDGDAGEVIRDRLGAEAPELGDGLVLAGGRIDPGGAER